MSTHSNPLAPTDGCNTNTNDSTSVSGDRQNGATTATTAATPPCHSPFIIALAVYLGVGVALPFVIIAAGQTASSDTYISDATVLSWALLLHAFLSWITFPRIHKQRQIIIVVCGAIVGVSAFILFDKVAKGPSLPQTPELIDLDATGRCGLFDPTGSWTNVGCRSVDYYYELQASLEADIVVNGSNVLGPASFTPSEVLALSVGRSVHHLKALVPAILFVTMPTTEVVEKHLDACRAALETFVCTVSFQPCAGSCDTSYLTCPSACTDVLTACPGIERLYDQIAPGTELRSVVYSAEAELGPFVRNLDRIFISLRHKCSGNVSGGALLSNLRKDNTSDVCSASTEFVPKDSGKCNHDTRSSLKRENDLRMLLFSSELNDYDNHLKQLDDTRRALPYAIIAVFMFFVVIVAGVTADLREQIAEAGVFWLRWHNVVPRLTHLALPLQVTVIVVLLLMARHIEQDTEYWYVAVLNNVMSLALLSRTIHTVVCYVGLEDDCHPDADDKEALNKQQRKSILYEISVYGRYFAMKVCLQEALEIAIQFTYFFVAIRTTDAVTVVIQGGTLKLPASAAMAGAGRRWQAPRVSPGRQRFCS
eukprot:PhM_4_TR19049/c0_g1_i3/m.12634